MLVVHPSSRCDVCLVEYNWDSSGCQPYAIACGHIFCRICLFALTPPLCPLCRKPFLPPKIKKLHVDRPDPSDPYYNSNSNSNNSNTPSPRSGSAHPTGLSGTPSYPTPNPNHLILSDTERAELDLIRRFLLAWDEQSEDEDDIEQYPLSSPARSSLLLQLRLRPLLEEARIIFENESASTSHSQFQSQSQSTLQSQLNSALESQWRIPLLKTRSILRSHTELKQVQVAHKKLLDEVQGTRDEVRVMRVKNRDLSDVVLFEQEKAKRAQEVFGVQMDELKRQIHLLKKTNKSLYKHNITYTPHANPLPAPPTAIVPELKGLYGYAASGSEEYYANGGEERYAHGVEHYANGDEGYNGYEEGNQGYTNGESYEGYDERYNPTTTTRNNTTNVNTNPYGTYTPSTSSLAFAHISEYASSASTPVESSSGVLHSGSGGLAAVMSANLRSGMNGGHYSNPTKSGVSPSSSSYVQPRIVEGYNATRRSTQTRFIQSHTPSGPAQSHTPSLHSQTPSLHSQTPVLPRPPTTSNSISPTTPSAPALSTSPSRSRSVMAGSMSHSHVSMPPPIPATLQAILPPLSTSTSYSASNSSNYTNNVSAPPTNNVFAHSSDPYNLALAAIGSYANGYVRGQEQARGLMGVSAGEISLGNETRVMGNETRIMGTEARTRRLVFSGHDVEGEATRLDDDGEEDDDDDDDDDDGEDEDEEGELEGVRQRGVSATLPSTSARQGIRWNNTSTWGTFSESTHGQALSQSNLNAQNNSNTRYTSNSSTHPNSQSNPHSSTNNSNSNPNPTSNPTSNSTSNSTSNHPPPSPVWSNADSWHTHHSIPAGQREGSLISGLRMFSGWEDAGSVRSGGTGMSVRSGVVGISIGGGEGRVGGGGTSVRSGRSGLSGLGLRNLEGGWESMSGVLSGMGGMSNNGNGNGNGNGGDRRDSIHTMLSFGESVGSASGLNAMSGTGGGGVGGSRPMSPSRPVVSMVGVLPRTAEEEEEEEDDDDERVVLRERERDQRERQRERNRSMLGLVHLVRSPEVEYRGSSYPGMILGTAIPNEDEDIHDEDRTPPHTSMNNNNNNNNNDNNNNNHNMSPPLPLNPPMRRVRNIMPLPVTSPFGSVVGSPVSSVGRVGSGRRDSVGLVERDRDREGGRDRERERDSGRERERDGGRDRERDRVTEDGAYYYRPSDHRHATTGSADYRRRGERERDGDAADRDRERERDRDRDRGDRDRERERDRDREYHTHSGSHSRSYSHTPSTGNAIATGSATQSSSRPAPSAAAYYGNPTHSRSSSHQSQYQSQSQSQSGSATHRPSTNTGTTHRPSQSQSHSHRALSPTHQTLSPPSSSRRTLSPTASSRRALSPPSSSSLRHPHSSASPTAPLQSFGNALGLDLTTVQPGAPPIAPRPVVGGMRRFGVDGSWQ